MKDFLKKYRKLVFRVAIFWSVLLILFIVNLVFSMVNVNNYVSESGIATDSSLVSDNWNNLEIQNLMKEKLWLEQQLLLAKSDSFSLGINLKESVVQVQLKGTVLFRAKILEQSPAQFFTNIDRNTYLNFFGDVAKIDSSIAGFSKRPIQKVIAPAIGTEKEITKTDTTAAEQITWNFTTSNQIRVVIYGVEQNPDSTFNITRNKDLFNYRIKDGFSLPFSKKYTATLFLWINDNDAKSIYRALPDQSRFIFRN